jgi:formate hydrogenlyase subunit 3/multisubunit Na+/H+ antiporter MnhD subunit
MNAVVPQSLDLITGIVVFWIVLGFFGLALQRAPRVITQIVFPFGAFGGLILMIVAGVNALNPPVQTLILPLGLPDLPFHLRLDALSAFFLLLQGSVSLGISLFSAGYFRNTPGGTLGLLCLQYHLFLASMALVFLADDAYLFMVAWEAMALSSYFLVTTDHAVAETRKAGFLYFLIAHIGAIAILLCFGVLHGTQGDYTFSALRETQLSDFWANAAFLLALFGFGAKAGMLPLHVWLPEAHPAAPSPVSALMSGVMLKTAIYGMVRVIYDLIGNIQWQWGLLVLFIGAITCLFGVLYALMQHDLKRLLAYHSVENIGIILLGLGLSMIFFGAGHPLLGALGLIAALYHTWNHAVFKGLLFLGAGAILHHAQLRNLNHMGGLIRRMPHTAVYFLIGALAISALPPLNGFVSEWLTFQAALQAPVLQNGVLRSLIPIAAATLALASALTAMCFVKVFGVAFLGQAREAHGDIRDAGGWERLGLGWLAFGCIILGLLPVYVIQQLDAVSRSLTGAGLGREAITSNWLWLVPITPSIASYSPVIFLAVILGVVLLTFLGVRKFYHGRVRRAPAWDCGFPAQTPRMQDTADAFGQPIRHIFGPIFLMRRHLPAAADTQPKYHVDIQDRHWYWFYLPVARAVEFLSNQIGKLQQGRIHVYLLYSFLTLLALLLLIR